MSESNLVKKGPLDTTFVTVHRMMTVMREAEPGVSTLIVAYDSYDKGSEDAILVSSLALPAEVEALIEAVLDGQLAVMRTSALDKAAVVWEQVLRGVTDVEPSIRLVILLHDMNTPLLAAHIVGITNVENRDKVKVFLTQALNSATLKRVLQNKIVS